MFKPSKLLKYFIYLAIFFVIIFFCVNFYVYFFRTYDYKSCVGHGGQELEVNHNFYCKIDNRYYLLSDNMPTSDTIIKPNMNTYINNEYNFEFEYPKEMVLMDLINNPYQERKASDLIISYIKPGPNALRTPTYCEENGDDPNGRCEDYNNFIVDWDYGSAITNDKKGGLILIALGKYEKTNPDFKISLKNILSTFKFETNLVSDSQKKYGGLQFYFGSHNGLLLTDPQGNQTGNIYSQKIIENIPNSAYFSDCLDKINIVQKGVKCGETLKITQGNAQSGNYSLSVSGEMGDYYIVIYSSAFDTTKYSELETELHGNLKSNTSVDKYEISFSSDTGKINVIKK